MDHLSVELLSALADGEVDLSAERSAAAHLAECEACAARIAAFQVLDRVVAEPAPVACASVRELRSALLDGELTPGEARVAAAHLASCRACGTEQVSWSSIDAALAALPAALPPTMVDARVATLTAPVARPRAPLTGPAGLRGLAGRGAVAVAVVTAIVAGLLPSVPAAPDVAREAPGPEEALVASVQQVVFYSQTNTLYVLQTAAAAVDAMDATTYALRRRIVVGGRPTALALHEAQARVLVLDASQRSLIEIDATRNEVVSTTPLEVTGTPTSVDVDRSSGKIYVAAIPDEVGTVGAPRPTTAPAGQAGAGVVAVLDGTTKKLETIRSVEVAPRLVVADPSGQRTLLVSTGGTTLVDPSYKTLKTLPGGVAAAFDARGDRIAVLSADAGAAVLHLIGDGAPGPLRLQGAPLAVASIPGVGFAVLLGSGSGNGRIVVVDEAGRAVGSTEVAQLGRDLAYDASSRKLTVVGSGTVASVPLPAGLLAGVTPLPEASVPSSARPSPETSAAPSQPAAPSASPATSPGPLASPSLGDPKEPVALASPSVPDGIPAGATRVRDGLYRLDLDGRTPVLAASTVRRVWFLDAKNGLNALEMSSGAVFPVAQLPRDAEITSIALGASQVYAADGKQGRLFTFDTATERWSARALPFLHGNVAMTVAPDGRIWLAMDDSSQILTFDPRSGRIEAVDTGLSGIVALAIDNFARVWFSDGNRLIGSYDLRNGRVTQVAVPGRGAARTLLPDPSGSIWVGTSAGEVISVRDGVSDIVVSTTRPIVRLSLDLHGVVWYLTPAPSGSSGFVYGPASAGEAPRAIPGPATSLDFSLAWGAWIADPSGAFYIGVEAPK